MVLTPRSHQPTKQSLLPQWNPSSDERPPWDWWTAAVWYVSHALFFLDIALDVALAADLFAVGLWFVGVVVLGFICACYGFTWYHVVQRVISDAEWAPMTFGFDEEHLDFYIFNKVVPWRGEFADGFAGQPIIANAILAGPFGVMALDVLLAVRALNDGLVPFDEVDYAELHAFFRWYSAVRLTHEAIYEALPGSLLKGAVLGLVIAEVLEAPGPTVVLLGASLVLSVIQVFNRVLLVMWKAAVRPQIYFEALDLGLPMYELVMNALPVLELDFIPMGEHMDALAMVLSNNTSVHVVRAPGFDDLRLIGGPESVDLSRLGLNNTQVKLVGAVLRRNPVVKTLDLRGNRIQQPGVQTLCDALAYNRTLEKLLLENNLLQHDSWLHLAAPFATRSNNTLKYVNICGTDLPVLSAVTSKELALVKKPLRDPDMVLISELIRANRRLERISLVNTEMTDDGVCSLGEVLRQNRTVTDVQLDTNRISDIGAKAIADMLAENSTVEKLSLACNWLGDKGGTALAQAMEVNSTVTELNLSTNRLSDACVRAFAKALGGQQRGNKTLAHLHLDGNEITGVGVVDISMALEENEALEELSLERNQITNTCTDSLAQALEVNGTLTKLTLNQNKLTDTGAATLAKALEQNTALTHLNLRGNKIQEAWTKDLIRKAWGGRSAHIYL